MLARPVDSHVHRYLSSNWDLEEVEKDWKDKIVAGNGLVSKLSIPQ